MIEILHYEKVKKNKIVGYVDIKLPKLNLILRRIAHCQDQGKTWFNFPAFPRETGKEKPDYVHHYEFINSKHNMELFKALYEPVKKYCQDNHLDH